MFFEKITDYQQFSPVNDMLSTSIGKGYIILINDKSLWGKHVLRNADFRFCAQIRSHFLLHQEANHHRYFEGYPYFLLPYNWHTSSDITWDIPTFLLPLNWHTNNDTPWDIPSFLPPLICHTISDTHWDIPTFSSLAPRDTLHYIPLTPHRFAKHTRVTHLVTFHRQK